MDDISFDDLPELPAVYMKRRVNTALGALFNEGWRDDYTPATRLDVLQALGLVSVCSTCDDGWIRVNQKSRPDYGEITPCPDCTDGLVVSPEAVERLGVVIQDMWVDTPAADGGLSESIAEAGLRAALGVGGTG